MKPIENLVSFFKTSLELTDITRVIVAGIWSNIRIKKGWFKQLAADTHSKSKFDPDKSVDYIDRVFNDYLYFGDLTPENIKGKTVMEIGPGDNIGVGIKFLLAGAEKVYLLEKFPSDITSKAQIKIYKRMRERLSVNDQKIFDTIVKIDGEKLEFNRDKIDYLYGKGFEEARSMFNEGSIDIIVSRAVLEEIINLDYAFKIMDYLLKKNGLLIHKVDLRDYGLFSKRHHPLTFLMIPDYIWHEMTSHSPRPNRKLVDYYRDKLSTLGYDYHLYVTHIVGKEEEIKEKKERLHYGKDFGAKEVEFICNIKDKLIKRYKEMSVEDLLISGIFIVAKKP